MSPSRGPISHFIQYSSFANLHSNDLCNDDDDVKDELNSHNSDSTDSDGPDGPDGDCTFLNSVTETVLRHMGSIEDAKPFHIMVHGHGVNSESETETGPNNSSGSS